MQNTSWLHDEAQRSLKRLLPGIEGLFAGKETQYQVFVSRLNAHFPRAFQHLYKLYGSQYDFFYHLQQLLHMIAQMFLLRSDALHALDRQREADSEWFLNERMIGAVCYVDLFAGNLEGIRQKIDYFKELGITYLHLMPLFDAPEESDGGYAISDYRKVNPALGTMQQLAELAAELRANGISLALDFVFNHTSNQHTWARKALAGDQDYQRFYYMFPDRILPDQYEATLREIFPEQAPGSFTYVEALQQWVWTTFNSFQWDLNYSNPEVFNAMLGELLFLVNQGVEILRFDAVAFIWKRMGTPCENLPEVHDIIRALNALVKIVAPGVLFKSEAIVHPDDVASYIDAHECQISYNPTYMALIWEALATRKVSLLRHSMSKRFDLPPGTAWVNYVRVHDDIGWSFANEDALEVGITGYDHRLFLNEFYTGLFPGSFATGLPFNFNPQTMDTRICGTAASLAGLEQGIQINNALYIEHARRRIIMMHSLIIAAGGIPLIYLGDEIATMNEYSFRHDPNKAGDNRWVHRPVFDWQRAEKRHDTQTVQGRVFQAIRHMIDVRSQNPVFRDGTTLFVDVVNPHVLAFLRNRELLVLANFSDEAQTLDVRVLAAYWTIPEHGFDLYTQEAVSLGQTYTLEPYQFVWLVPAKPR